MGEELDSRTIAYRLLLAWDIAWESYKGFTRGVGALPGIALIEVAELVPDEERRPKRYWLSKVRAEINLAFRQSESEGWFSRQNVSPFYFRDFGSSLRESLWGAIRRTNRTMDRRERRA